MQYVNELIHDYRCFLLPVVVFVFGWICSGGFYSFRSPVAGNNNRTLTHSSAV